MQNKPNLLDAQMNLSSVLTKDYENKRLRTRGQNKPNQTQSEFIPKGAKVPTGELLAILKPGTNQTQFLLKKHAFLQISYHFLRIFANFRQFQSAIFHGSRCVDKAEKKRFLAKKSPFSRELSVLICGFSAIRLVVTADLGQKLYKFW